MKLAIFDFDGTLIKTDSLPLLLRIWSKLGYKKHRQLFMYMRIGGLYIRYKFGLNGRMTAEQMKKTAFQKFTLIFKGMNKEQIREYFEKSLKYIMPELNEKVVSEVKAVKEKGFHTIILSGFYQPLLELLAKKLDIETVLGTEMIYKDDIIDEKKQMNIRTGSDKVSRIKEQFPSSDLEKSCAYADSISDLELLELVGTPVAVKPDSGLREIAIRKGWRIIE